MELYAEFEGTVQKDHHNLLGAGALENLLGTTDDATLLSSSLQKKVADLDRDCGELCISIYDLKEATAKWQLLNLSSVIMSWDEKVCDYVIMIFCYYVIMWLCGHIILDLSDLTLYLFDSYKCTSLIVLCYFSYVHVL